MTILSIVGLAFLIIGVFLVGFGFRGTQSLANQVVEGVTGRYSRRTTWLLIGGGLLALIGIFILLMGLQIPVGPMGQS